MYMYRKVSQPLTNARRGKVKAQMNDGKCFHKATGKTGMVGPVTNFSLYYRSRFRTQVKACVKM